MGTAAVHESHAIKHLSVFTALYMMTASGHMYVRAEVTRHEVTRAIVEHGALAVEQGDGDIARDGRLYGKYGLAVYSDVFHQASGRTIPARCGILPGVQDCIIARRPGCGCVTRRCVPYQGRHSPGHLCLRCARFPALRQVADGLVFRRPGCVGPVAWARPVGRIRQGIIPDQSG